MNLDQPPPPDSGKLYSAQGAVARIALATGEKPLSSAAIRQARDRGELVPDEPVDCGSYVLTTYRSAELNRYIRFRLADREIGRARGALKTAHRRRDD